MAEGRSNAAIAERMRITENPVAKHRRRQGLEGCGAVKEALRPMLVMVSLVGGEHAAQVGDVPYQGAVEKLCPAAAYPPGLPAFQKIDGEQVQGQDRFGLESAGNPNPPSPARSAGARDRLRDASGSPRPSTVRPRYPGQPTLRRSADSPNARCPRPCPARVARLRRVRGRPGILRADFAAQRRRTRSRCQPRIVPGTTHDQRSQL